MKYEYGGILYESDDFYCYPDTNVLLNRFDIRNYEKLQEIERDYSHAKIALLAANPIKGAFNLKYLLRVYLFAGL